MSVRMAKLAGSKEWGRTRDAVAILGVDRQSVAKVAAAAGVTVRRLPGLSHPLYSIADLKRVAEQSTKTAGA